MVLVMWSMLGLGCRGELTVDPYTRPSSTYQSLLLADQGGRLLVSLVTSTPDEHLLTVDPRTGERLTSVQLTCSTAGATPQLFPAVGTRAWVRCGRREAYVLDLVTGTAAVSYESLLDAHPDLSAGFRLRDTTIDLTVNPPTRSIPITLHDGRIAYLDLGGDLRFEPDPTQTSWVPGYYCWPEHKCSRRRRECLGFSRSPSGVGYQLSTHRIHGEKQSEPVLVGSWPVGLLMPGLVGEPHSRCAYERDEQHLVLHDSAAFEPKNQQLSLMKRTGEVAWSVPFAALGANDTHQPRQAIDRGDEILVLVGNTSHKKYLRAVTVDAGTGAVLTAHDLFGHPPSDD